MPFTLEEEAFCTRIMCKAACCQVGPHCRTAALLPHRFAHAYMTQFPFFKLWPDAVQRELARVLLTEVRVCHETIIARATPLTKVFFLLRGTVSAAGREGGKRGRRASGG